MHFADILPVYHLGNSQMLSFWGPVGLSRRLRMSVGIFWGAYGLPLPRKHDLVSVAGFPIKGVSPLSAHALLERQSHWQVCPACWKVELGGKR